jgi:hypothetical protein
MVDELTQQGQTSLASQVHIQSAPDKKHQNRYFGSKRKGHETLLKNKQAMTRAKPAIISVQGPGKKRRETKDLIRPTSICA